jgi:hypothetical protein
LQEGGEPKDATTGADCGIAGWRIRAREGTVYCALMRGSLCGSVPDCASALRRWLFRFISFAAHSGQTDWHVRVASGRQLGGSGFPQSAQRWLIMVAALLLDCA